MAKTVAKGKWSTDASNVSTIFLPLSLPFSPPPRHISLIKNKVFSLKVQKLFVPNGNKGILQLVGGPSFQFQLTCNLVLDKQNIHVYGMVQEANKMYVYM